METYESPRVIDLGDFADLTQIDVGKSNDISEAVGSG
jgi:hypothetical protein